MSNEKIQPYPPAYTEIYPAVNANVGNNDQMGWRQPEQMPPTNENLTTPIMSQPIQPPPYGGTQQQQSNQPASILLRNQSRVGLYPIKLTPCPHCMRDTKTTISYDSTLKTHLSALILCLMCCWCCSPLLYLTNNATKAANHFCESCKSYIGSYERRNPCKW